MNSTSEHDARASIDAGVTWPARSALQPENAPDSALYLIQTAIEAMESSSAALSRYRSWVETAKISISSWQEVCSRLCMAEANLQVAIYLMRNNPATSSSSSTTPTDALR